MTSCWEFFALSVWCSTSPIIQSSFHFTVLNLIRVVFEVLQMFSDVPFLFAHSRSLFLSGHCFYKCIGFYASLMCFRLNLAETSVQCRVFSACIVQRYHFEKALIPRNKKKDALQQQKRLQENICRYGECVNFIHHKQSGLKINGGALQMNKLDVMHKQLHSLYKFHSDFLGPFFTLNMFISPISVIIRIVVLCDRTTSFCCKLTWIFSDSRIQAKHTRDCLTWSLSFYHLFSYS